MKRHCIARVVLLVTLAAGARSALAQTCPVQPGTNQVNVCPSAAGSDFANTLGYSPEQLAAMIQNQINDLFQVGDVSKFLQSFQNAQAFSSKGLGVDYASEATLVEVGATLSLVSNVDKAYQPSGAYKNPPISGGAANFSLMGGVGLGLIGLDPVMIFGNWFKGSATLGQLNGSYDNWGVHAQLRLFGPTRKSSVAKFVVRWGGIAITTGADYSRMTLSASQSLSSSFNLPAAPGNSTVGNVSVTGGAKVGGTLSFMLQQTTWTVPIEVTTSLRLLSLITVYGGLGMDLQLGGGSDMQVSMLDASLSGQIPGATGSTDLGKASVSVSQHVSPSPARLREIIGLQLGIFDIVRLFLQVNTTGSSPMLTSLAAGLRLGI